MSFRSIVEEQRHFFLENKTKDISFRLEALKLLKESIIRKQSKIEAALKLDLNKSAPEAYLTEISIILKELTNAINNIKKWSGKKKVSTPLSLFPARSHIIFEPYGVALIISPWNYPFFLTFAPLIGAIAAGNCCIVKPSEFSVNSTKIIAEIISDCFNPEYIKVIDADHSQMPKLLEQKFDYIFFTGSPRIARKVMEKAAVNLTPLTLELGGKSPCIVDKTADLKISARRIIFGKLINSGQTCIAPDYLLVEKSIEKELIEYLIQSIKDMYGEDSIENPNYPRIINLDHYNRINALLNSGQQIVYGGYRNANALKIAPTIIKVLDTSSAIMQEEIFGPLLPYLTFNSIEEAENLILSHPKPLAAYIFTKNKNTIERLLTSLSFGGGCINDTIMHVANPQLGFGGIGESGFGRYKGRESFITFSHQKTIMKNNFIFDWKTKYPPYTSKKIRILKHFL